MRIFLPQPQLPTTLLSYRLCTGVLYFIVFSILHPEMTSLHAFGIGLNRKGDYQRIGLDDHDGIRFSDHILLLSYLPLLCVFGLLCLKLCC